MGNAERPLSVTGASVRACVRELGRVGASRKCRLGRRSIVSTTVSIAVRRVGRLIGFVGGGGGGIVIGVIPDRMMIPGRNRTRAASHAMQLILCNY